MNVPLLDRYKEFVSEEYLSRIYHNAQLLKGCRVLHVNTTMRGGGVATLLQPLLPLMEELGIQHTWKVIQLDQRSNQFTTHIVNLLQGNEPGDIGPHEKQVFLDKLHATPTLSKQQENHADVYCIHDFQLVPLATLFPWIRPAIWFCHVDTANPNPHAKEYIKQFLAPYTVCTFNSHESVFPELSTDKAQVITPAIDPFDKQNAYLAPQEGMETLRRCGIDTTRPLITQVSRFDRWKNPWQVIDVYRQVKQHLPTVQVALVGAMEAADDIQAVKVFKDVQSYAGNDPDIHLFSDAKLIQEKEVNAFQRYSSVILQRSSREGFGLTATEAMWKYQPVIGTNASGLRRQMIDGKTGYNVDDTETCTKYTLELLQHRDIWKKLGEQAHEHVRTHYLFPMMLLGYLDALLRARGIHSDMM